MTNHPPSARIPSPRQGAEAGRGAYQPTAGRGFKERPILFSAPMVRAILEGRKTQTRRVCKGARELSRAADWPIDTCPYGAAGDRLWVRETWREREPDQDCYSLEFRADRPEYKTRDDDPCTTPWRPSIYMPRTASRISLDVTGVRVERLQDISYEDACAEGCSIPSLEVPAFETVPLPAANVESWDQTARRLRWPQRLYEEVWESINGADSWAANPWVWVIEFKRVTP